MTEAHSHLAATNLEQLATQLDRALDQLEHTERRFANRQTIPGEVAYRDPKDTYHQITLGAVLVAHGLSAHDARTLAGLLATPVAEIAKLMENIQRMREHEPDAEKGETVGSLMQALIVLWQAEFEQVGRFAEWRRAFDRYMAKTEPFLSGMTEEDLAKMRERSPSKGQLYLVRTTCAYHRLEFPALANRGEAFEWLRNIGANARYREWG